MTYDQFVAWVESQGKTLADVLRWWAEADAYAMMDGEIGDLTDFLLSLSEGKKLYDAAAFKAHWEDLDDEGRENYPVWLTEAWSK